MLRKSSFVTSSEVLSGLDNWLMFESSDEGSKNALRLMGGKKKVTSLELLEWDSALVFSIAASEEEWGEPPLGITPVSVTLAILNADKEGDVQRDSLIGNANATDFIFNSEGEFVGSVYSTEEPVSEDDPDIDEPTTVVTLVVMTDNGISGRAVYHVSDESPIRAKARNLMSSTIGRIALNVSQTDAFDAERSALEVFVGTRDAIETILTGHELIKQGFFLNPVEHLDAWSVFYPYDNDSVYTMLHRPIYEYPLEVIDELCLTGKQETVPYYDESVRFFAVPPVDSPIHDSASSLFIVIEHEAKAIIKTVELVEGDEITQIAIGDIDVIVNYGVADIDSRVNGEDGNKFYNQNFNAYVEDLDIIISGSAVGKENSMEYLEPFISIVENIVRDIKREYA